MEWLYIGLVVCRRLSSTVRTCVDCSHGQLQRHHWRHRHEDRRQDQRT